MRTKAKSPSPKSATSKKPPERTVYGARDKCSAVLSLWAERRKPSEVCKELGVTWTQLRAWQDRAMEGMLVALTPKTRKDEEKGPALGERLAKLLEKKTGQRPGKLGKLEARLSRIQQERQQKKTS
jgi:hypothetical protein